MAKRKVAMVFIAILLGGIILSAPQSESKSIPYQPGIFGIAGSIANSINEGIMKALNLTHIPKPESKPTIPTFTGMANVGIIAAITIQKGIMELLKFLGDD